MNKKGFTLIEMMIVIAIIAILAAVALPNMMGAKMAAAERAGMSELRTIGSALETYFVREGEYPNNDDVNYFDVLHDAELLPDAYDGVDDSVDRSAYTITVETGNDDAYVILATPRNARLARKCYVVVTGGRLYEADGTVNGNNVEAPELPGDGDFVNDPNWEEVGS